MSNLIDLINQYALAAAQGGDWQTVASTLNGLTNVVRDPTPITYARIRELFGESKRQLIAATIRTIAKSQSPMAGEMEDAHRVMLDESVGFRIDLDERQAMLQQLGSAAGWDQDLVSAIAALGVRIVPLAGGVVTQNQCQTAWEEAEASEAAQLLSARRGVLESALRNLPVQQIVGDSRLPTQQQVIDRIIEHCTAFGVTFGG